MNFELRKIKIIDSTDALRLTAAVNDFIKDKVVFDIKFQSLRVNHTDGTCVDDRVLIIYRDNGDQNG